MDTSSTFTAARIASTLGCSARAVRRALERKEASTARLVSGNVADAWFFDSLPETMQKRLEHLARKKGYRNADHLLSDPPKRYTSPTPIQQLAATITTRAANLRNALKPSLLRFHEQALTIRQLTPEGLKDFYRIFGYAIHERHWRRLFQRAIQRDAGEQQWDRLDLYVEEQTAPVRPLQATRIDVKSMETLLLQHSREMANLADPTAREKALLWQIAFEQMAQLVESGTAETKARKAARRTLWNCGVKLAKNEASFAQLWRVNEAKWQASSGSFSSLLDQREKKSGHRRAPELPQSDVDEVIARAVRCGGRVSQAWREVLEEGLLSPAISSYYDGLEPANKSYVPQAVREAARHDVRLLEDIHHGARRAQLNGAYLSRDWTACAAGDFYQADDVTFNAYYYAPDESGRQNLMRGQVLIMIDTRSTCILGFAIIDARNYNAHAIRTLITRVCDSHGMPRKGFYFERGIWQSSRLLSGDRNADAMSWNETETGLRELGLGFRHARLPRAKPIERVIGSLQALLDGLPGDAGRREMTDGFEPLQKAKRLVESGRNPASDFFLNHEEMEDKIAAACERYNEARNDGKMTQGLAPSKAWQHFQSDPLVKLPGAARYLLAHHKRPLKVGRNGITLRFGKNSYIYRNEQTGRLKGQKVLAWFNPEMPELLAVTDMNRENPFTVERSHDLPAMDADPEILEQEMGSVEAHNSYARNRYRMIASKIKVPLRTNQVDRSTADLGRAIEAQAQQVRQASRIRTTRETKVRRSLQSMGFAPRPGEELTDDQAEGAETLKKLFSETTE
jgi:hypothetical protein